MGWFCFRPHRHIYPFQSLDVALWSEPWGMWNEDAASSARSSLEISEAPSHPSLLLRESMGLTTTYHHHRSLWSNHLLPGLVAEPQPASHEGCSLGRQAVDGLTHPTPGLAHKTDLGLFCFTFTRSILNPYLMLKRWSRPGSPPSAFSYGITNPRYNGYSLQAPELIVKEI